MMPSSLNEPIKAHWHCNSLLCKNVVCNSIDTPDCWNCGMKKNDKRRGRAVIEHATREADSQ